MKFSQKSKKFLVSLVIAGFILAMVLPLFQTNLASAQTTYSVTINTIFNGATNGNSVAITQDGLPTGFSTPHTFSGLTGTHNFTVPYEDDARHPFRAWAAGTPSDNAFTTIQVSASGSYYANYFLQVNPNSPGFAQYRYFVTPNDPAVAAAALGKNWSDIINWVATNIAFNQTLGDHLQYPNETLAIGTGVCREYAGLSASMLLNRGYNAYCIFGNVSSGVNHVWLALEVNGVLYHFEPQATWALQPNSANWTSSYTAKYFYNTTDFFAALPSQDPPVLPTYSVTIGATFNLQTNNVYVPITMDGSLTAYITPHTFSGLTGLHNFTLPYQDSASHFFIQWQQIPTAQKWFTTISTTSSSSFMATFSSFVNNGEPGPASTRLFITPNDPAVVAAASGKDWNQIINYVSSLPSLTHQSNSPTLCPNQTLSGGRTFTDFTTLACSMLRANGYNAYLAASFSNRSICWIVLEVNGAFIQVNAYTPWSAQITSYQADYYVDQNGVYPASTSVDPPAATPTPTQAPTVPEYPPTFAVLTLILVLAATAGVATKKRTPLKFSALSA